MAVSILFFVYNEALSFNATMKLIVHTNTTDINDLVLKLSVIGMKPLLDDEVWQCYGYKKIPKKGLIVSKMFPNKLEDFITKEILTLGLIDVLNGIKKSNKTSDTKLLLSIGI